MAYSYNFFSKQLVGSDKINLIDIFPDIQAEAKQSTNVSYGLADIVLFLQDVTQDFQRAERQYIDLDNAIQSIVKKYFDSKNISNPFNLNTTMVVQVDGTDYRSYYALVTFTKPYSQTTGLIIVHLL